MSPRNVFQTLLLAAAIAFVLFAALNTVEAGSAGLGVAGAVKRSGHVKRSLILKREEFLNYNEKFGPSSMKREDGSNCTGGKLEFAWFDHKRCQCTCHHIHGDHEDGAFDLGDEPPIDFTLPLKSESAEACKLDSNAVFFDSCRCWC